MPATTNPTPAEISRLERAIAEEVMGWRLMNGYFYSHPQWRKPDGTQVPVHIDGYRPGWSPWRKRADAWEVLKTLRRGFDGSKTREGTIISVCIFNKDGEMSYVDPPEFPKVSISLEWDDLWSVEIDGNLTATAHGPHFGPAVCRLAEKILDRK